VDGRGRELATFCKSVVTDKVCRLQGDRPFATLKVAALVEEDANLDLSRWVDSITTYCVFQQQVTAPSRHAAHNNREIAGILAWQGRTVSEQEVIPSTPTEFS